MATNMDQTTQVSIGEMSVSSCSQAAINNIKVPKIDEGDVFTFLNDFEDATSLLEDCQRIKLLTRSFPSGRLRNWYNTEVSCLNTWATVRSTIIKRFSYIEDRDHHLFRIKELKFEAKSGRKLYDFGDELYYSLSKALPESSEESKVRFLKTALPESLIPELALNPGYNQNTDHKLLLSAFRQYDKARVKKSINSVIFKETVDDMDTRAVTKAELLEMKNDLVETFKQLQASGLQHHQTMAAQDSDRSSRNSIKLRPSSPYPPRSPSPRHRDQSPGRSPYRQEYRTQQYQPSTSSALLSNHQSRSPNRQQRQQVSAGSPKSTTTDEPNGSKVPDSTSKTPHKVTGISNQAFSEAKYYEKFGVPPRPCIFCKMSHWDRHCIENLN